MSFVHESYGAVCNGRISVCCQIELGSTCLLSANDIPSNQWECEGTFPNVFYNLHTVTVLSGLPFRISLSVTFPDDSITEYLAVLNSTESEKKRDEEGRNMYTTQLIPLQQQNGYVSKLRFNNISINSREYVKNLRNERSALRGHNWLFA